MHQSNTLYVGMDVHKELLAVAYVANAYGADGVRSCGGPQGPRGRAPTCHAPRWLLWLKRTRLYERERRHLQASRKGSR